MRTLKNTPGSPVTSVEELLASGLHSAQLQGFLEGANGVADDYFSSGDYRNRLAARDALGKAIVKTMDENRLDAIAYPTTRRIAPRTGGNQIGTNAGLSAQTGFPAITVPAGFTPSGFPVGIELLGRQFAEPTLIGLAYAYEQSTRHRRPPSTTPPLGAAATQSPNEAPRFSPEPGALTFEATAKGTASDVPVPFNVMGRFTFNSRTRQLGYDVRTSGPSPDEIGGIYLHRRASRMNGGVALHLVEGISVANCRAW